MATPKRLVVGVRAEGFLDWTGGTEFLGTLISGLHAAVADADIRLIVPDRGPRASATRFLNRAKAALSGRSIGADNSNLNELLSVTHHVHHTDLGAASLADTATRIGIDILIPSIAPLPPARRQPFTRILHQSLVLYHSAPAPSLLGSIRLAALTPMALPFHTSLSATAFGSTKTTKQLSAR
jgi:hypothetical protein